MTMTATEIWDAFHTAKEHEPPLEALLAARERKEEIIPVLLKGVKSFLEHPADFAHVDDRLPLLHHDPFDRLLIVQAIQESLTLVTPDRKIHSYPVRTLW